MNINEKSTLEIREFKESDLADIKKVHVKAFGDEKGPVIAKLAIDLLHDKTALPLLSLVAIETGQLVGHIIFTNVQIINTTEPVNAQILAPLAVVPDVQKTGIGNKLINAGLQHLKESKVELVFVLGHPDYYSRYGFKPAGKLGFEAPYPIPEELSGAWMVQELHGAVIGTVKGMVKCSDILNQPEHWRE